MNKKISVLMSIYNSEETIEESINSVLNQTFSDFEFLIIDDCSTDSSLEIIKRFEKTDQRITVFCNEENLGLTRSLNKLIQNSNFDFIARQDSDDRSFPNRLETQMKSLINLDLDFCTTRALKKKGGITPNLKHYLPYKFMINYLNPFIHGTLLIKKQVLEKINGYDERFYYAQDYKLFKDLIKQNFKFKVINSPLYYLNTINNISSNKKKEQYYYASCVRNNKIPNESMI